MGDASETLLLTVNCKIYVLYQGSSWVDLYARGKARVSIYSGLGKARLHALKGGDSLIDLIILPTTTFAMAEESNFFQIDGDKTDNTYGLSFSTVNELHNFHEHIEQAQASSANAQALPRGTRGEAMYAYNAQAPDHISLKKGDVIENVQPTTAPGWSRGTVGVQTGVFPTDYIREYSPSGSTSAEPNPVLPVRNRISNSKAQDMMGSGDVVRRSPSRTSINSLSPGQNSRDLAHRSSREGRPTTIQSSKPVAVVRQPVTSSNSSVAAREKKGTGITGGVSSMHVVDESKFDKKSNRRSLGGNIKKNSIGMKHVADSRSEQQRKSDPDILSGNTFTKMEVTGATIEGGDEQMQRQKIKELQDALAKSYKRGQEWEQHATQLANEKAKLVTALADSVEAVELWKEALDRQTGETKEVVNKYNRYLNFQKSL